MCPAALRTEKVFSFGTLLFSRCIGERLCNDPIAGV
ncbi:hypothetical protein JOF28_002643 [Leucobacter exalbidus]|uniref:Uncharacterized protein n=1 Tax=Leucobacter exalbidus TaxID=662960 RepID=A0A940PYJ4_9MICO|nr:hypothetical protein [Leucobacter exalbidus]